ncbi:hypothetical protein QFC21_007035 [Naganishia friedmannii]|uniref:Uncharacterized protein n=1 Tax=Naganishia friedmannii TaxID=89922 RepID=A0ACC2UZY8_9TREE|nr:hypothetical protein QFC21_007035 [Naganishia friedmannii]
MVEDAGFGSEILLNAPVASEGRNETDVNLLEASADVMHLAEMKAEEVKVLIEDIGFEADVISKILVENEDSAGNTRSMQQPTSESKNRTETMIIAPSPIDLKTHTPFFNYFNRSPTLHPNSTLGS